MPHKVYNEDKRSWCNYVIVSPSEYGSLTEHNISSFVTCFYFHMRRKQEARYTRN